MKSLIRLVLAGLALMGVISTRPMASATPVAAVPRAEQQQCTLETTVSQGFNWRCEGECLNDDECTEMVTVLTVFGVTFYYISCRCGDGPPLGGCSGGITIVYPSEEILLNCVAQECTSEGCELPQWTPPGYAELCTCTD